MNAAASLFVRARAVFLFRALKDPTPQEICDIPTFFSLTVLARFRAGHFLQFLYPAQAHKDSGAPLPALAPHTTAGCKVTLCMSCLHAAEGSETRAVLTLGTLQQGMQYPAE